MQFTQRTFMKKTMIQFIKFGIVGVSNTIISYLVYYLFVRMGFHYIIASIFGFIIGVLNAFFWNNKYVFKSETGKERNIVFSLLKMYISYGFSGLFLQNLLLFILIELLFVSKYIAPLFCLFITVPLNFLLNRHWTFKEKQKGNANGKN